jgi:hypothetical protein
MYNSHRILIDTPSAHAALGFDEYANALKDVIENSNPRFAIGIFGSWGSGKTTLMDMLRDRLDPVRAVSVDFSAWRYEKEPQIIIPLLDTVRQSLVDWAAGHPEHTAATAAPAARRAAETLGKVMAALIAGFSLKLGFSNVFEVSYEANKSLQLGREYAKEEAAEKKEASRAATSVSKRSDPDLPQSFYHASIRALTSEFKQFAALTNHLRIVVFVDDLDRCLPRAALEVLEAMKLFFDLEGFVFVVGLDRAVVERCIETQYRPFAGEAPLVKGADYIKKIFQVPINLAPVSVAQLDELLTAMYDDGGLSPSQRDHLNTVVKPHLRFVSETRVNPREVKRFVNAYTLQMKIRPQLQPNVVLALLTLRFRPDWERVKESIEDFGADGTDAIRRFLEGEEAALDEQAWDLTSIPPTFRNYVLGPGRDLLHAADLDEYIYSGAATQASAGTEFLHLGREVAQLRILARGLELAGGVGRFQEKLAMVMHQIDELRSIPDLETSRGYLEQAGRLATEAGADLDRNPVNGTPDKTADRIIELVTLVQHSLRVLKRQAALA